MKKHIFEKMRNKMDSGIFNVEPFFAGFVKTKYEALSFR